MNCFSRCRNVKERHSRGATFAAETKFYLGVMTNDDPVATSSIRLADAAEATLPSCEVPPKAPAPAPVSRFDTEFPTGGDTSAPLWTKQQLAEYLQVDIRTIENWMQRRCIPYLKIGKTVRFKPVDVIKHFDENCTVRPRKPRS